MAVTSGFYNSVNHDRKYNAMQLVNLLDGIINDGVFMTVGDHFAVSQNSGMTVKVGIGRAWFNMTWLYNDSQLVLVVEPSDLTLPRIDAVVVEVNTSQEVRAGTIKIIKGTPNASPVAPTMVSTATVHQYPLALISVGANVSSITADKITNKVGTADCPYVNGILTTSTVEAQAASWEAAFNTWFDGVKGTLSGDIAGNLLNLINDRVKYTDKSSEAEALAGTDDAKYMTASKVNSAIKNRAKPGDIKIQASPDIDSGWALCNGAAITRAGYPAIFDLMNWTNPSGLWSVSPSNAIGTSAFIKVVNGLTFIGTSVSTDSGYNSDAVLWVAQKNSSALTQVMVLDGSSMGNRIYAIVKDVIYDGAKYIAIVAYTNTQTPQYWCTLYTSTNGLSWSNLGVTPATPFANPSGNKDSCKLLKAGGYYAFIYQTIQTSNNYIGVSVAFSATLTGGSWASAAIATFATGDQVEYPFGFFYDNGVYEVITWGGNNSDPLLYRYTSSNIATGWSRTTAGGGFYGVGQNNNCRSIQKINGKYYFTGQSTFGSGARLRYSTDFISWTNITVNGATDRLTGIVWTGKYWIVSEINGNLYYNTQMVSSGWIKIEYKNLDPKYPTATTTEAMICMEEYLTSPDQIAFGSLTLAKKWPTLPLLSVRDAYAFIKTT